MAVIVAQAGCNLLEKIEATYLEENSRRWLRLLFENNWLFANIDYIGTSWHRVMGELTDNLVTTVSKLYF